ncbi:hypothetical protein [Mucilaginibacter sp. R-33]|uniref:hypothetical protein n=1 Tax=Mucilaginibacter sp. R-33 TaxID=3416711 RepID=UPI003CEDE817
MASIRGIMFNNQFISELKAQRLNVLEQLKHIEAMLKLYGVNVSEEEMPSYSGIEALVHERPYKKDASNKEKIAGLLKLTNRFLSINEMTSLVMEFEPKSKVEEVKASLSSAKNILLKDGSIVKVQVGTNNSNTFYGSPSWIDEQGFPLPEHKYSEDAVQLKAKIVI